MTDAETICTLLSHSLNSNPEVRKSAETKLTRLKSQDTDGYLSVVLKIFASEEFDVETRVCAIIHYKVCLRDYVLQKPDNTWTKLTPVHRANLKDTLLRLLFEEKTPTVIRRQAVVVISDLATMQIGEVAADHKESWDQLVPQLLSQVTENGPHTDSVVAVLCEITPAIAANIAQEAPAFSAIIDTLLSGTYSMEVKKEALKLVCIIAYETTDYRQCWPNFQKFIPHLMIFFEKTAKGEVLNSNLDWVPDQDDAALNCCIDLVQHIIEVSETTSAFFKSHIESVFSALFGVVREPNVDIDCRKCAGETILTILSDKPKMCKEVPNFSKMIIETSLLLMLSVEEKDLGSKIDEDDLADEPIYTLGERGIDHAVKALGDELFPELFGYVKGLIDDSMWQKRYAGITCICQTTEYIPVSDREATLKDLMPVVIRAINDESWMVRLAACRCIGQMAYDLPPVFQVQHTNDVLPHLIGRFDDDRLEVVHKALRAYTNFADELIAPDIEPYLEQLMGRLTPLVKLQPPDVNSEINIALVKENAITAISCTASVSGDGFIPFYPQIAPIMDLLSVNIPKYLKEVRGQAVDCISHIALAVGRDTFNDDGPYIMDVLMKLRKSDIADDDPLLDYITGTFKRMCIAMGDSFNPYIKPLIECYLPVLEARGRAIDEFNEIDIDHSFLVGRDGDSGLVAIKSSVVLEYIQTLGLIHTLIEQCKEALLPVMEVILEAILPLLKYNLAQEAVSGVLETCASCLKLMREVTDRKQQDMKEEMKKLLSIVIEDSLRIIGDKENLDDLIENAQFLCAVADGLAACLQHAGADTLSDGDINEISLHTFKILDHSSALRNKHLERLKDPNLDDEDRDKIIDGGQMQHSFRSSLMSLLGGIMNSHPEGYMRISGNITTDFLQNCIKSTSPQDLCLGLYLCNDILQYLGQHGHLLWPAFIHEMIASCSSETASIRQAANYGMVWAIRQSPFDQNMANAGIIQFAKCIQMNNVNDGEIQLATDNCIAAINVLLCFRGDLITREQATELSSVLFENYPLIIDNKENIQMTEILLKAVDDENRNIIGYENQNLPLIIGSLGRMYKTSFSNDAIDGKIAEFLRKLGAEQLAPQLSSVKPENQKYIERMLKDINL